MTGDLTARRRQFAEELRVSCPLQTDRLADAFAVVPRETYLPPGPWTIRGEADLGAPPRQTPDGDPSHVYGDVSVAIDPARQLFNGAPRVVARWIDQLSLTTGLRVLHVGCGPGYYSAIMAHVVGPAGRVVAVEIDQALAREARRNLAPMAWVDVQQGDGTSLSGEPFDAILIHAGVTHPLDLWLDALAPKGRLLVPLTCQLAAMGPISKGFMLALDRLETAFGVRVLGMVAIYAAIGVRDPRLNEQLGVAFSRRPSLPVTTLRRDPHPPVATCWLHGDRFCLSTA
jgi:protein-L-isoaspartate(D-aspartate) O-methyltransferase